VDDLGRGPVIRSRVAGRRARGRRGRQRRWTGYDSLAPVTAAMLPFELGTRPGPTLSVLAIGAHPDDIEIGAGGTLLHLAEARPGIRARYVVLTGSPTRQLEARQAAAEFLPGADLAIELHELPEGRLPAIWDQVKDLLETLAKSCKPDVIFAPSARDAHQDHRTIAEIIPTVFRDQLHLAYEIPKWDGDLGRPAIYVPMSPQLARRKVELLQKCFPSQHAHDWWDEEVFLGLARLRGMECRTRYAEGFTCTKCVVHI